jgi:two-component system nitrate/nitrite response regulator NarL
MDSTVRTSPAASTTRIRRPRVVIVEEHRAVADLLDASLWGHYRVRSVIVSEQTSVATTVAAARAARPDVALVAARPGPLADGETVISRLRNAGVRVIALSTVEVDEDPVHWGRCLLAGAGAVLAKSADLTDLRRTLDQMLADQPPLCPSLAARLREAAARAATDDECWTARERLASLSLRERKVIAKLVFGRSPLEIAREDVVAEATVRTQIKSILAKLEVNSQLGAVAVARRAGWSASGGLPLAS